MIKIGVAGLGRLGKVHLEQLSSIDGFHIEGIFDINKEVLSQTSKHFNLPVFERYEDMLPNCGAILIATPTSSHFSYAEPAIRMGRHVFIEKPITADEDEAKKLTRLAEEAGVFVQVGHVERFNPAFVAIKNRPLNPRFIESHRLAQFNPRGTDVSVVLDLMIHDIDIILSIVKSNVKRVHASGVAVITDSIDIANARIEFDNGAVANLTASRISFKRMRKMRLFQHNEYIGIDFLDKQVDLVKLSDDENGIPLSDDKSSKKILMEQPVVGSTNAIREELLAFMHSIRSGQEPEVNATQASKALDLADQILYKIRKNNHLQ